MPQALTSPHDGLPKDKPTPHNNPPRCCKEAWWRPPILHKEEASLSETPSTLQKGNPQHDLNKKA